MTSPRPPHRHARARPQPGRWTRLKQIWLTVIQALTAVIQLITAVLTFWRK